jgi:hypothetical protein
VTRLERCPETHDAKCAATEPCEEECMPDGINWRPGMPAAAVGHDRWVPGSRSGRPRRST